MDLRSDESMRDELRRLSPNGDLVAVADDMRSMGVDSLLVCRPDGRIAGVVSEHRVRRLAQPVPRIDPAPEVGPGAPFIPEQAPHVGSADSRSSSEGEGVRAQTG